MKKQITEYYCDVCGKKVDKLDDLKKRHIPVMTYNSDGTMWSNNEIELDLCEECREELLDICINQFAKITDMFGYIESDVRYNKLVQKDKKIENKKRKGKDE